MSVGPVVDIRIDGHVHTRLCGHASGSMADYVRSAIRRGLHTIIFLEHLEVGIQTRRRTWLSRHDFKEYFVTISRLQRRFGCRIRIVPGVEIGWNPDAVDELRDLLGAFPWQWRGISYHFYRDGSRHLNMVSHNPDELKKLLRIGPKRILDHYFQQLIQAHRTLNCQVVCHLDAALRHLPGIRLTPRHRCLMDTLFEDMARRGTRLEINTSGLAMRGAPFPDPAIIDQALAHDISLLPGSDAHHPEQVGRFLHLLPELLNQGG